MSTPELKMDMQTKIYEEIFRVSVERNSALQRFMGNGQKNRLKNFLKSWQDSVGISEVELDPDKSAGFTRAISAVLDARPASHRRKNNLRPIYILAVNEKSGSIELLVVQKKNENLEYFLSSEGVEELLLENSITPYSASYNTINPRHPVKSRIPNLSTFYGELQKSVRYSSQILLSNSTVLEILKDVISNKKEAISLRAAISIAAKEVLDKKLDEYILRALPFIDKESMDWAEAVNDNDVVSQNYGQISTFNKLKDIAQTPLQYEFYSAAIMQFSTLGKLYWDEPIWDDIKGGQAPFRVLSEHLNIKPSTLKHLSRAKDIFSMGADNDKFAPYLDNIDYSLWPKTTHDVGIFKSIVGFVDIYAEIFDKDAHNVLKTWVSEYKKSKLQKEKPLWLGLLDDIYKSKVAKTVNEKRKKDFYVSNTLNGDVSKLEKVKVDYKLSLSDISDMKSDVTNRILKPQIILALEKSGYRLAETTLLDDMVFDLNKALWSSMAPADQISASSYWHSPEVNIRQRFESVSLSKDYSEWHSIIPNQEVSLSNKVVAHCLTSSAALREEGFAMKHCVWSYASNCFRHSYHIISMRDQDGNRLSTLNLQDYFEGKERKVKSIQNKSSNNSSPNSQAVKASAELVKLINERDIEPEWDKIDSIRAEYKIKEVESAAGYDFRDEKITNDVLSVYLPCLPRKLFSGTEKTIITLADRLNIQFKVDEFLENFDFKQGGILKIKPKNSNPQPLPQLNVGQP